VFDATQKLSRKASCKTPILFHSEKTNKFKNKFLMALSGIKENYVVQLRSIPSILKYFCLVGLHSLKCHFRKKLQSNKLKFLCHFKNRNQITLNYTSVSKR